MHPSRRSARNLNHRFFTATWVTAVVMPEKTMPKTKEGIELTACPISELNILLNSKELRALEGSIASRLRLRLAEEVTSNNLSNLQGDISVSGMTCGTISGLILSNQQLISDFAVRLISLELADNDNGEFGPGEEQDVNIGHATNIHLKTGFAIGHVIALNFLLHRKKDEHIAYLKNRRVPRPSAWIKELQSVLNTLKPA